MLSCRHMFGRKRVRCLAEFLDAVNAIQDKWKCDTAVDLWFRGESTKHKTTSLVPKVYRPERPVDELLETEYRVFQEFTRCGHQLCDVIPEDDWEWYFLMQHHGAPTRLLDWSDGALIALHFAIADGAGDEEHRVVYVIDPDWLDSAAGNPTESHLPPKDDDEEDDSADAYLPRDDYDRHPLPDRPLVLTFPHFTRRIGAQRSRFVAIGRDRNWLQSLRSADGRLAAIQIDGASADAIKGELRTCGVTESVIFPDLDGLGAEMNSLWRSFTST
jgi:hypothetical protein